MKIKKWPLKEGREERKGFHVKKVLHGLPNCNETVSSSSTISELLNSVVLSSVFVVSNYWPMYLCE